MPLRCALKHFFWCRFFAYSAAVGPLFLQHAKTRSNPPDLQSCLRHCLWFSVPIMMLAGLSLFVLKGFVHNCPSTYPGLKSYVYLVSISYGAYGAAMLLLAYFNAMLQSHISLIISVFRFVLLLILSVFILGSAFSEKGIFLAISLSHVMSALLAYLIFRIYFLNAKNHLVTLEN